MVDNCEFTLSIILKNLEVSQSFSARLAQRLKLGDVIGLSGPIGAGKSTIARFIINSLIEVHGMPTFEIPSPTFTLIEEYDFPKFKIFHIDLYRVEHPPDILELGLEELFTEGVALIEWPERLGYLQPSNMLNLFLSSEARYASNQLRNQLSTEMGVGVQTFLWSLCCDSRIPE